MISETSATYNGLQLQRMRWDSRGRTLRGYAYRLPLQSTWFGEALGGALTQLSFTFSPDYEAVTSMARTVHAVSHSDPARRDNDELDITAFLAAAAVAPDPSQPPTTVTANAMHRVVPTLNAVNLLMYDFAGQQEYATWLMPDLTGVCFEYPSGRVAGPLLAESSFDTPSPPGTASFELDHPSSSKTHLEMLSFPPCLLFTFLGFLSLRFLSQCISTC